MKTYHFMSDLTPTTKNTFNYSQWKKLNRYPVSSIFKSNVAILLDGSRKVLFFKSTYFLKVT